MAKVGIIGWGVVGQATGKGFASDKRNQVFWYDKNKKSKNTLAELIKKSEFIFVCVPTPMFEDESGVDLSIVESVVAKVAPKISRTKKILVFKSSIPPGTTRALAEKYKDVRLVMNPEFLTEINADWDFMNPDRVVIGAFDEGVAVEVAKLYRQLCGPEVKIYITDPTSAEMTKYMANTFMATKIIFANEMKTLADKLKINYDEVKKMVVADPRINEVFLSVTPFGGFGRKCFPKDIVALLGVARQLRVSLSLLKVAWKKNLKIRKVRDWEEIDGAISKK